jgi:hypothetical protein
LTEVGCLKIKEGVGTKVEHYNRKLNGFSSNSVGIVGFFVAVGHGELQHHQK